jgi:hypothetical protein
MSTGSHIPWLWLPLSGVDGTCCIWPGPPALAQRAGLNGLRTKVHTSKIAASDQCHTSAFDVKCTAHPIAQCTQACIALTGGTSSEPGKGAISPHPPPVQHSTATQLQRAAAWQRQHPATDCTHIVPPTTTAATNCTQTVPPCRCYI